MFSRQQLAPQICRVDPGDHDDPMKGARHDFLPLLCRHGDLGPFGQACLHRISDYRTIWQCGRIVTAAAMQDGRDAAEQAEQPVAQRVLHHGAHPGDLA